jgi:anti-sigma factor RsiW
MNCREFTEFAQEYLLGNLPAKEQAEFDKHLAEWPWCWRLVSAVSHPPRSEAS